MSLPRFGVRKPVPINLLMIAILIAGIYSAVTMRREFFPRQEPRIAVVSLPYPGADPQEVEEALAIKVEDAIADLDEVKELRTTLSEGGGSITVEFKEGSNVDEAVDEVERAIDALTDLPDDAERIQVRQREDNINVIRVTLFGDLSEMDLKREIRRIDDDLRNLPGMGDTVISGVREYEMRVDVDQRALVKHGISLPMVADAIGNALSDIPGGTVRSDAGDIKVRTIGAPEQEAAIREIPVMASADSVLRVKDIAKITSGFTDVQVRKSYNGKAAAHVTIYKVGNQDIVQIAEMAKAYVAGRTGKDFKATSISDRMKTSPQWKAWHVGHLSPPLPAGAELQTDLDFARFVSGRLELLTRNASYGAVLVFTTLLLFLNWRAAMWVGMGLLVAMSGTLLLMEFVDQTLNLMTMFGLIVVLGLLVDDAIVVSENIQSRHDKGEPAIDAAILGTEQVLWPVVATVMTTVVAFMPLLFVKGGIGELLGALPVVVACALLMSLVEALLILPSHMGHSLKRRDNAKPGRMAALVQKAEGFRDHILLDRIVPGYGKLLRLVLHYRYVSAAIAIFTLLLSVGMVSGGRLVFNFLTGEDAESVVVDVRMPIGTPIDETVRVVSLIERAALSNDEVVSVSTVVGQSTDVETGDILEMPPHVGQMFMELKFVEDRDRTSGEVIQSIREAVDGQLGEAERVSFLEMSGGPGGPEISVEFHGEDTRQLSAAVAELKQTLAGFDGVYDIADSNDIGQLELQIRLRPSAMTMGFTLADVSRQVRGSVFGLDAHTYAADREDIDVRVRLDESARRSLQSIENAWLINPAGDAVPLSEIAEIREGATYTSIKRVDRQRSVSVTADVVSSISPETIVQQIDLDAMRDRYPTLDIRYGGRQQQMAEAFASLPIGLLASIIMIYVILAWLFSSYTQPLIVLLVVPFSFVGVVWGHLLLGYEMTFLSLIGFVALTGIVVNDSLILVEFYNVARHEGNSVYESLVAAGVARFRAIMLTTITTVLGLTPLILEQSFQAKFIIPMAITIAMGLVAATMLVLLVVPCFMLIFHDIADLAWFCWHGYEREDPMQHQTADDSGATPPSLPATPTS